jgi:hypothetical protein
MGNTLIKMGRCIVNLKVSTEEALDKINTQAIKMKATNDINLIKNVLKGTEKALAHIANDNSIVSKFQVETVYQENDFSVARTQNSILKAKENAIFFLENLMNDIKNNSIQGTGINPNDFSEETALIIIKRILNNFYCHIESMYEAPVHGKAQITRDNLDKIKIGNEYDVQRILYSLIKPIFPESRVEVCDDTGYGTIRYDIIIEKYNVAIEVKCSRSSMSERTLSEELGSDAFHYNYANIFFFIYDKYKVVKNKTAFIHTYNRVYNNKNIDTVIIQPVIL